jgi:hypothetical protein
MGIRGQFHKERANVSMVQRGARVRGGGVLLNGGLTNLDIEPATPARRSCRNA